MRDTLMMAKNLVCLVRLESGNKGTFGGLRINGACFCVTLEPSEIDTEGNLIPEGIYRCNPYHSIKYPNTYEVTNVAGRHGILFHSGNTVEHTHGCVLLGEHFGKLKGERAILNSGKTFQAFMERMGGEDFVLRVWKANYVYNLAYNDDAEPDRSDLTMLMVEE